ncbi:hypothetical protein LY78DRAFT_658417 [Colletotrichum sublineola]|nr:hypothetical protein LY78DRAFT_658417 [Colletotrichum sublineola]
MPAPVMPAILPLPTRMLSLSLQSMGRASDPNAAATGGAYSSIADLSTLAEGCPSINAWPGPTLVNGDIAQHPAGIIATLSDHPLPSSQLRP